MNDLRIESTQLTPEIDFKKTGELSIKGKSLPENPSRFYEPLFDWLNELETSVVSLDVMLEYVNTSSSKNILELFRIIDNLPNVKELNLEWRYETDDIDMLEFGQIIERSLKKAKVSYIEFSE